MKLAIVLLSPLFRLVELATVVLLALMISGVSVSLDRLRQPLIDAISEATAREVNIDGELRLGLSLFPALLVEGVHIYNAPGWQSEEILTLNEARFEMALAPLLDGEIVFQELTANQAVINLEQDAEGNNNWTVSGEHDKPGDAEASTRQTKAHPFFTERAYFDHIRLKDIELNYRDALGGLNLTDQVDVLNINMLERSQLQVEVSGVVNDTPYTIYTSSNLLRNIPENQPWEIKLQGQVAGKPILLDANIQITDGIVSGQLDLQAGGLDAAKLLKPLKIAKGLHFQAQQVHLAADLEGSSLMDLIKRSSFNVNIRDGAWKLKNHIDGSYREISFSRVSMTSLADQDLKLELIGAIGGSPLTYVQYTNPLAEIVSDPDRIDLDIEAQFAGAQIKLDGNIGLPVSSKTLAINLAVSGDRLDQWNARLSSDLPPYGPYTLSGHLSLTPDGFQLRDLKSKIANSDLSGNVMIDMTAARPLWKMNLISSQLQINDFDVEGYSLIPTKEPAAPEKDGMADEKSSMTAKEKERAFSHRFDQRLGETREIDQWDIDVNLESHNIHSGEDRLGSGEVVISAREGSFNMAAQLNTLGGRIDGDVGIKLVDDGIRGHVKLDMDKFDYGIFLRRIDPESDANGLLSTRVDVQLAGKDFAHRFDRANGMLDFVLWPQNISAGEIDLWAVNIFQAVSSSVISTDSTINCAVGLFDIEEGQLNEEFLAVDTTKVWLYGNVDIHYPSEAIELALLPRAKKPKIGGIQTPVYLQGNLNDNFSTDDLIVKKKDVVKTFFSIVFSPLHVPMRRIFGEKVPADASEICGKLLDRDFVRSFKGQNKRQGKSTGNLYDDW